MKNTNLATVAKNKLRVDHAVYPDLNREYLTLDMPNGWDDVKKIYNKVLVYKNKDFVFSGWNSDVNKCYFYRLIDEPDNNKVAVIA